MSEPAAPSAKIARCPTCRKPAVQAHRPFCSRRCADIDLARWLGGSFVIAGSSLETADDSELNSAADTTHRGGSRDPCGDGD